MKVIKYFIAIFAFLAMIASTSIANAAIINFDEQSVITSQVIQSPYKELTWNNFGILNSVGYGLSGLAVATLPNAGFNLNGMPASFLSSEGFYLKSFYISAWYRGAFDLLVKYYDNNNNVISQKIPLLVNQSMLVNVNKSNIYKVEFTPVDASNKPVSGRWFLIDDMDFTPVPEPSSVLGCLVGLVGLIRTKTRKLSEQKLQ
jgi:hypothetical protein